MRGAGEDRDAPPLPRRCRAPPARNADDADDHHRALFLDGPLSLGHLRDLALARLLPRPRFRMRIQDGGAFLPRWVNDRHLDVRRHVHGIALAPSVALADVVSALASTPLPADRPRWSMHLVTAPRATTLVVRVHHAIGDGVALLAALDALSDRAPCAPVLPAGRARRAPSVAGLRGALQTVLPEVAPPALLSGALGGAKRVAWGRDVPLAAVRGAAHRTSATVGEMVLVAAAGGLGRWMQAQRADPARSAVSALVPVHFASGHGENRFGSATVPLPVAVRDPSARLWAVRSAMGDAKRGGGAALAAIAVGLSALVSPRLAQCAARHARAASLTISDVTGPPRPLSLGGVRVGRMVASIPAAGRIPLTLGFLSYAGRLGVAVTADAQVIPDPAAIAAFIDEEWRALATCDGALTGAAAR